MKAVFHQVLFNRIEKDHPADPGKLIVSFERKEVRKSLKLSQQQADQRNHGRLLFPAMPVIMLWLKESDPDPSEFVLEKKINNP